MLIILWELRADPIYAVLTGAIVLLGIVVGFTVHEFSHALAALGEGDPTARRMGRLTFNPIRHVEPFGFILILAAGFGWARPVQVDPYNLRHGRLGMSWVALSGPLSNFVLAFLLGLLFRLNLLTPIPTEAVLAAGMTGIAAYAITYVIFINLMLGIVNLIPLPPIDGSKVLGGLLPESIYYRYLGLERFSIIILISLVGTSFALSFVDGRNIVALGLFSVASPIFGWATGIQ